MFESVVLTFSFPDSNSSKPACSFWTASAGDRFDLNRNAIFPTCLREGSEPLERSQLCTTSVASTAWSHRRLLSLDLIPFHRSGIDWGERWRQIPTDLVHVWIRLVRRCDPWLNRLDCTTTGTSGCPTTPIEQTSPKGKKKWVSRTSNTHSKKNIRRCGARKAGTDPSGNALSWLLVKPVVNWWTFWRACPSWVFRRTVVLTMSSARRCE